MAMRDFAGVIWAGGQFPAGARGRLRVRRVERVMGGEWRRHIGYIGQERKIVMGGLVTGFSWGRGIRYNRGSWNERASYNGSIEASQASDVGSIPIARSNYLRPPLPYRF
jgi:hypothetical protein